MVLQARRAARDSVQSSKDLLKWLMHRMTPQDSQQQQPEAEQGPSHRPWRA